MKDKINLPYLSPVRRELFLQILNGEPDFHPFTMKFYYLNDHFHPEKLDLALSWLVRNNYVGIQFLQWHKYICNGSDLEMVRQLLAIVNNDSLDRLIAGKNFKV